MAKRVPIDWDAYQASKKTGRSLGSMEELNVGIRVIAAMNFGSADVQVLQEIADMNDPGFLEWLLHRLKGASLLREIRALSTPPEELDDPAPPQPH